MNKLFLLGRLTRDPEVRYTQTSNIMVANFSLAVNRPVKEEKKADVINIVSWGKIAEFVNKYFKKGQQIVVEGRIQTRNYENSEGKKIYVTEVIAERVYFADSKKDNTEFENTFGVNLSESAEEAMDLPF